MSPYTTTVIHTSQVANELEVMRCLPTDQDGMDFPAAARHFLYSLPGNRACVDCGGANPQWASVSFGTLLCLQCSGNHRGMGVKTSRVRSVEMDTWSHTQVLAMLEGGNFQLQQFFERHRMGNATKMAQKRQQRYHTKAAAFYRVHLAKHAQAVADAGVYEGREATRQKHYGNNTGSAASTAAAVESCCAAATANRSEQPRRRSLAVVQ
ncbi:with coiled-coil, ANK repeat and PH domain-containing protein [Seminavis robusta]|uniref:With coiled-coil, ANK repeat and PH domain-containing protein n=1 Tax=Seminavis robusta TaxID=568900 RepID=A0A9N8EHT4_9STRA|nr:with coiled-coil, ANK repeat and PH domain-containing protein [Seminavis robusta]|eukprot:Sro1015_g231530.1 with coiled-coil, ANK repeat and PH domain-containing protein (209) ;mRNA; f:21911-22537